MAQIDIEKKENNNQNNKGLYIIIAILVLAGIIWWILAMRDDEDGSEGQTIRPEVKVQPLPKKLDPDPLRKEGELTEEISVV